MQICLLYNGALILSRLHYGNTLWGDNPGSLINLFSLPDIHQMKMLCLYIQYIDSNLPHNIHLLFQNIDTNRLPDYPRSAGYSSTIRYELPTYLNSAPPELLNKAKTESHKSFKRISKKYIIERYSSLCTKLGCGACHLILKIK